MKRIRVLPTCPQGIASYLSQGGDPTDWDKFYDCDPYAYRQLRDALTDIQHGLCGYCESALQAFGTQIEHVVPKNPSTGDPGRALDYTNLIACCSGVVRNPPRAEKGKKSESCGQAKGENNDLNFVDPRDVPALPGLCKVRLTDGEIMADESACNLTGVSTENLNQTILTLGLNAPRLKRDRFNRLETLYEVAAKYVNSPDFDDFMRDWARDELLLNDNGTLNDFFTTRRSYFAPLSEDILAEQPKTWI